MTAQFTEILQYQGRNVSMCTNPLDDYFALSGTPSPFESNCTALWRGYIGHWEIIDDRLYLVGVEGSLKDGTDGSLATLFPGYPDRVFAHWYCGTLRIPQGRQLEYVHMGYASTYEQDLLLDVDRGVVTATRLRLNGEAKSESPDGYGVAAMTVMPRGGKVGGGAD